MQNERDPVHGPQFAIGFRETGGFKNDRALNHEASLLLTSAGGVKRPLSRVPPRLRGWLAVLLLFPQPEKGFRISHRSIVRTGGANEVGPSGKVVRQLEDP